MATLYTLPHQQSGSAYTTRKSKLVSQASKYKYDNNFARDTGLRGVQSNPDGGGFWYNLSLGLQVLTAKQNTTNANNLRVEQLSDIDPAVGLEAKKILMRNNTFLQAAEDALYDNPSEESLQAIQCVISEPVCNPDALPPLSVNEYADLYVNTAYEAGEINAEIFDDETFARMALAGGNPTVIERVSAERFSGFAAEGFPVTDAVFQTNSPFTQNGDNSLAALQAAGKLYIEDYSELDILVPHGEQSDREEVYNFLPKALYGVTEVFWPELDRNVETLMPIAIQCRQTTNGVVDNGAIFYPHTANAATYEKDLNIAGSPDVWPETDYSWQIAKTICRSAGANHHEMIAHLGMTHLMMETFILSIKRNLSASHPIHAMLNPHFFATFSINENARSSLVVEGGIVDGLFTGEVASFLAGSARSIKQTAIEDLYFPNDVAKRDIADLPHYHYRDDAYALWGVMHDYVSEALGIFYTSEADLQADLDTANGGELGALLADLANPQASSDGLHQVDGLTLPPMNSREDLYNFVTLILFTATAKHASVNSAQEDRIGNPAMYPTAIYKPAPTGFGATRKHFLESLPPFDLAIGQVEVGIQLGSFEYAMLKDTSIYDMKDTTTKDASGQSLRTKTKNFKTALKSVKAWVEGRNSQFSEERQYHYLHPDHIPRSINV